MKSTTEEKKLIPLGKTIDGADTGYEHGDLNAQGDK
jgi:hypothetical protein